MEQIFGRQHLAPKPFVVQDPSLLCAEASRVVSGHEYINFNFFNKTYSYPGNNSILITKVCGS